MLVPGVSRPSVRGLSRGLPRLVLSLQSQRAQLSRHLQHEAGLRGTRSGVDDIAFVFDIDGVILRSSQPVGGSPSVIKHLQKSEIPFLFLTNGGGKSETARIADLRSALGVDDLYERHVVLSHTPFKGMNDLFDKNVLVVGGDADNCRHIAHDYGFRNVYLPSDLWVSRQDIWPFSKPFAAHHDQIAVPADPSKKLKIDAIFVYNDPRDWGLDMAVIIDLLLSRNGEFGTRSDKNGDPTLPGNGYLQDGQPRLYFSNPDMWWSNSYHLTRLGQGAFQEALKGVWYAATRSKETGSSQMEALRRHIETIGKPHQPTFEFAEKQLRANMASISGDGKESPLRTVYMIGDNPDSDIQGANGYKSPNGTQWTSVLVKTGVYQDGHRSPHKPRKIVEDVYEAMQWALDDARGARQ